MITELSKAVRIWLVLQLTTHMSNIRIYLYGVAKWVDEKYLNVMNKKPSFFSAVMVHDMIMLNQFVSDIKAEELERILKVQSRDINSFIQSIEFSVSCPLMMSEALCGVAV